jgi:hypothetical protein
MTLDYTLKMTEHQTTYAIIVDMGSGEEMARTDAYATEEEAHDAAHAMILAMDRTWLATWPV